MTLYIVIAIGAVGLLAAIPLVHHWDRQERDQRRH